MKFKDQLIKDDTRDGAHVFRPWKSVRKMASFRYLKMKAKEGVYRNDSRKVTAKITRGKVDDIDDMVKSIIRGVEVNASGYSRFKDKTHLRAPDVARHKPAVEKPIGAGVDFSRLSLQTSGVGAVETAYLTMLKKHANEAVKTYESQAKLVRGAQVGRESHAPSERTVSPNNGSQVPYQAHGQGAADQSYAQHWGAQPAIPAPYYSGPNAIAGNQHHYDPQGGYRPANTGPVQHDYSQSAPHASNSQGWSNASQPYGQQASYNHPAEPVNYGPARPAYVSPGHSPRSDDRDFNHDGTRDRSRSVSR